MSLGLLVGLAFLSGFTAGIVSAWQWLRTLRGRAASLDTSPDALPGASSAATTVDATERVIIDIHDVQQRLSALRDDVTRLDSGAVAEVGSLDTCVAGLELALQQLGNNARNWPIPSTAPLATVSDNLNALMGEMTRENEDARAIAEGYVQFTQAWVGLQRHLSTTEEKLSIISAKNRDVTESVDQAIRVSEDGYASLHSTIEQMEDARQTIGLAGTQMEELMRQLGGVEEIVRIIELVARQTNLLSLNAAILAAQSSHSQAFTVLASEIKTLAERTRISTRDISKQIHDMVNLKSGVEAAIRTSRETVEAAYGSALTAGDALNTLRDESVRMARSVRTVAKMLRPVPAAALPTPPRTEPDLPARVVSGSVTVQNNIRLWSGELQTYLDAQRQATQTARQELGTQLHHDMELITKSLRNLRAFVRFHGDQAETRRSVIQQLTAVTSNLDSLLKHFES